MAFDNARTRSLCKTITWRAVASTDTFLIAWLLTGTPLIAGGIAGLEIITKTKVSQKTRKPVEKHKNMKIQIAYVDFRMIFR